jgi:hypothetical protein
MSPHAWQMNNERKRGAATFVGGYERYARNDPRRW